MSAPLTLDLAIPKILIGYLSTAEALAGITQTGSVAGIPALPALDAMPRLTVYDNSGKPFPCLVFAASLEATGRDYRTITAVIVLNYKLAAEGQPSPREGYAAVMAAIERWLRSQDYLYAYLATLTQSTDPDTLALVTGWDLTRSPICGVVLPDAIDKQNNTGMIPLSIKFFTRIPTPALTSSTV